MSFFKHFTNLFLLPVMAVSALLYCGGLPENPGDPSNTAISVVMKTPDGKTHSNSLVDTINKKILIGAALRLPENFDSVHLIITFKQDTIFDTTFTDYGKTSFYSDTIWTERLFFTPGVYYATFLPFTSLNVSPVTANIVMLEADLMPENHKPVIGVSGKNIFAPNDTCVLTISTSDADANQILTIATKGKPEGSVFKSNTFTWIIPAAFKGLDTIAFIVSDNGYPQESDTETVVITVSSTPNAPTIAISGDSILKPLETCTLTIHTSDKDSGQTQHVTMTGNPAGAILVNDSQFTWTAPNVDSAKYFVKFTVTDNGIPPLSSSANITLIVLSSGTIENKNIDTTAPVITFVSPENGSAITSVSSFIVDVICSDTSGISSVGATFGEKQFPAIFLNGHYTMTITGLLSDIANTIVVTAKDSSVKVNAISKSAIVTYKPLHSVTYDANTGTGTAPSDENKYKNGDSVVVKAAAALTKTGCTFTGWNTAADGGGTACAAGSRLVMGNADIVLFARWTTNPTFTVTYNANTASGIVPTDANAYTQGSTVIVKDAGALTKNGYSFAGWNTLANGSGTSYAAAATFLIGTANVTLYAKWSLVPAYTVTYNTNTGSGVVPVDGNTYIESADVAVKGAETLTKDGYLFTGWNTIADGSGTSYATASTLRIEASNVTLYAKWSLIPTFTVTYNANTGSGAAPTDANAYNEGSTVLLKGAETLTKDGYSFAGWNTLANGNGTSYASAATLTIGTSNVILYAKWSIAQYTVTYDANSGNGTAPVDTKKYLNGENVNVLANPGKLLKIGASFAGWNTAANGNGTNYYCGQIIQMGIQNLILYAKYSTTSVMDNDGNVYNTVTIGSQVWINENLRTTKYNDGTQIPLVVGNDDWSILTTPGYCWYGNDETNKNVYGALYNWFAVNIHKLAPAGWHVSSDIEWSTLTGYCGDTVAFKLKEDSPLWNSFSITNSNSTGFSALPGGTRDISGAFNGMTTIGKWWSGTQDDNTNAISRVIFYFATDLIANVYEKGQGASVRCIRDN